MNKSHLKTLVEEYNFRKGIRRRLVGDDIYIKKLKTFIAKNLTNYYNNEDISYPELGVLYNILRERKLSLKINDQYYNQDRLTNHIFHKIIFKLAEENYSARILSNQQHIQKTLEVSFWGSPLTYFKRKLAKSILFIRNKINTANPLFLKIAKFLDPKYCDSLITNDLPDIVVINPDSFPQVVTQFRYVDVLGQKNEDRLSLTRLENLNPRLLSLTEHGELIYALDVIEVYKNTGELRNPQSVDPNTLNLSKKSIARAVVTKPLFHEVLNRAVNERYNATWGFRGKITQEIVDRIKHAGLTMNNDQGENYQVSYNALAQLGSYLESLPQDVRSFILNINIPDCRKSVNEIINSLDVCRHVVGRQLIVTADFLVTYVKANTHTATPSIEHIVDIDFEYTDALNGLKVK